MSERRKGHSKLVLKDGQIASQRERTYSQAELDQARLEVLDSIPLAGSTREEILISIRNLRAGLQQKAKQ